MLNIKRQFLSSIGSLFHTFPFPFSSTLSFSSFLPGRKANEWDKLAAWFYEHRLAHENVRWLIQIPRLYHIYRSVLHLFEYDLYVRNVE